MRRWAKRAWEWFRKLQIVEWVLSLAEQLGFQPLFSSWFWGLVIMIGPTVYGGWLWFSSLVPLWAVPLLVLAAVWLVLSVFNAIMRARNNLAFDKSKYREFGADVLNLQKEMAASFSEWTRDYPMRRPLSLRVHEDRAKAIAEIERNRQIVENKFLERFSAKLGACLVLLRELGIVPPSRYERFSSYSLRDLIEWLGTVGVLLAGGKFEEAQTASRRVRVRPFKHHLH